MKQYPLEILPGTDRDKTEFATKHYSAANRIRYANGFPEKIGGYNGIDFDSGNTMSGIPRNIFPAILDNRVQRLIGTHEKLYNLSGSTITNIAPLKTATTAIANSIDTHYATLANDPVSTTSGSQLVVIADTEAALFETGDSYTLSGATTTNGILDTQLNAVHVVRAIGVNTITIRVSTAASGTGSGGGASVVRASGLITVDAAAHGMLDGDRVKLAGAVAVGGVTAAQINIEHIIRNKTTNTFDVMTAGTATSSVSNGGGASTTYQIEIDDGLENEQGGIGYGAGLYGVGLYGTALSSDGERLLPRIWYMDRFGPLAIMTPGNQTGLYEWDGDTAAAPVLVSGAPTAINYAFVSDNTIITFGDSDVPNRIKTSDQGDRTNWTSSSTNSVYVDDIEGAGRLLSHANALGTNLIYTSTQTYTFRKIAKEAGVWEIRLIDPAIGIIGSMARVSAKGIIYWMGNNNFYFWRGGNVEVIPANSQAQSTIHDYVFNDMNTAQKSKCFAWFNERFNEVWFHYPSAASNEPDRVARVNIIDFAWSDESNLMRTASEYPAPAQSNPYMADNSGIVYVHETGSDADGAAMEWSLSSPLLSTGPNETFIAGFIPDATHTGNVSLNVKTKQFPKSPTENFNATYTLATTTQRVATRLMGKYVKFNLSGSVLDQAFRLGQPMIEIDTRGRN